MGSVCLCACVCVYVCVVYMSACVRVHCFSSAYSLVYSATIQNNC